jgi:hypothetical protein
MYFVGISFAAPFFSALTDFAITAMVHLWHLLPGRSMDFPGAPTPQQQGRYKREL